MTQKWQIEAFVRWVDKECGGSPSTLRSYRSDLKLFEAWSRSNNISLARATSSDARRYLDERLATNLMRSTVERSAVALRRYFLFRGDHEARHALSRVTKLERYPRAAPVSQIVNALDKVATKSPSAVRNRAMLEVLYSCGMRVSELMALELSDVDRELKGISVGDVWRPLGIHAFKALEKWLSSNGRTLLAVHHGIRLDEHFLFVSNAGRPLTRQGVNFISTQSTGLMPYVFRDSCARHMIDRGAPIDAVHTLLGTHAVDDRYASDFPALRRVHAKCHPRG